MAAKVRLTVVMILRVGKVVPFLLVLGLLVLALAGCLGSPAKVVAQPTALARSVRVALDNGTMQTFVLAPGTGLILGSVSDAASEALEGIHVSLLGTDHTELTPATGRFLFADLPAGSYKIRADAKGYRAAEDRVEVKPLVVTRIEIAMLALEAPAGARPQSAEAMVSAPSMVEVPTWLAAASLAVLALGAFVLAIVLRLRSISRLLRRGRKALKSGDPLLAEKYARRVLARVPGHPDAWFLTGACLIKRGRHEEAVRQLEHASAQYDPHVAGLAFLITLANKKVGRADVSRRWLPVVARDQGYWDALGRDPESVLNEWLGGKGVRKDVDPMFA